MVARYAAERSPAAPAATIDEPPERAARSPHLEHYWTVSRVLSAARVPGLTGLRARRYAC